MLILYYLKNGTIMQVVIQVPTVCRQAAAVVLYSGPCAFFLVWALDIYRPYYRNTDSTCAPTTTLTIFGLALNDPEGPDTL